jgi:hypothetical protein
LLLDDEVKNKLKKTVISEEQLAKSKKDEEEISKLAKSLEGK